MSFNDFLKEELTNRNLWDANYRYHAFRPVCLPKVIEIGNSSSKRQQISVCQIDGDTDLLVDTAGVIEDNDTLRYYLGEYMDLNHAQRFAYFAVYNYDHMTSNGGVHWLKEGEEKKALVAIVKIHSFVYW